MAVLNAIVSGLICLLIMALIMHPRVHEGLVAKLGLSCMALGFFGVAVMSWTGDWVALPRALVVVHLGLVVVVLGYVLRMRRAGHPLRRVTDFGDLDPLDTKGRG